MLFFSTKVFNCIYNKIQVKCSDRTNVWEPLITDLVACYKMWTKSEMGGRVETIGNEGRSVGRVETDLDWKFR